MAGLAFGIGQSVGHECYITIVMSRTRSWIAFKCAVRRIPLPGRQADPGIVLRGFAAVAPPQHVRLLRLAGGQRTADVPLGRLRCTLRQTYFNRATACNTRPTPNRRYPTFTRRHRPAAYRRPRY